jgi:hypothetical protein
MGLDDVRDPKSDVKTLATFNVQGERPGIEQTA